MVQYIEFLFDNFTFTFVHWPPSSQLFDSFLSLPIDKANTDRKTNREGTFFSANTRNWNIHYFCFVTKKTQKMEMIKWFLFKFFFFFFDCKPTHFQYLLIWLFEDVSCVCVCVCVCKRETVCAWQRERERERSRYMCVCLRKKKNLCINLYFNNEYQSFGKSLLKWRFDLRQIFYSLAPDDSKNTTCFKSCQKRPKNNVIKFSLNPWN